MEGLTFAMIFTKNAPPEMDTSTTCSVSTPSSESCSYDELSVRFGEVEIREYGRVLGDNPSCSARGGPPVSIGWLYNVNAAVPLDEYEEQRHNRKNMIELRMKPSLRRHLMETNGFTVSEIEKAAKSAQKSASQRRMSFALSDHDHILLPFESMQRKFKRLFRQK